MIRLIYLLLLMVWITPATAAISAADQTQLRAAISGPQRSAGHRARDQYRHPLKTLSFFGVQPNMHVIEVLPEGGWYTEILAPYLRKHGKLTEATFPTNSSNPFLRKMAKHYREKLQDDPKVYGKVSLEPFAPPGYLALGAPDSADRVLSFRNMHDLVFVNPHGEPTSAIIDRFFRNAYQVLKPGGVLGIVAHRAKSDMAVGKSDKLGRLPQRYVIDQARKAGFKLVATSQVNSNPKDSRTLPVWYLPPSYKQGKKNREKYKAIGEADNMTLKFMKPR